MAEKAVKLEAENLTNNTLSITPLQGRLIGACGILFCLLIVLSIISAILNFKKKNKKRAILQIVLSVIALAISFYIVGNSINIFGMNSDLYMGLIILSLGNILTFINIFKK